jgi:hypothetical protein
MPKKQTLDDALEVLIEARQRLLAEQGNTARRNARAAITTAVNAVLRARDREYPAPARRAAQPRGWRAWRRGLAQIPSRYVGPAKEAKIKLIRARQQDVAEGHAQARSRWVAAWVIELGDIACGTNYASSRTLRGALVEIFEQGKRASTRPTATAQAWAAAAYSPTEDEAMLKTVQKLKQNREAVDALLALIAIGGTRLEITARIRGLLDGI